MSTCELNAPFLSSSVYQTEGHSLLKLAKHAKKKKIDCFLSITKIKCQFRLC